jgi:two-component system phosphate regulon sensor histidine kinase PhoR
LASINGFIETLLEVENDKDTQLKFLQIMKEQSHRMTRLVDELLVLSNIESGFDKLKFELVSLPEVLNECLVNIKNLSEVRNISIKPECSKNLPQILAERDHIIRILDNLLSNAIKYSNSGSDVFVKIFETNNLEHNFVEFPSQKNLVCISVKDFGEGIDEKHIPRLTERFFRVDKARSRNLGGNGLGLSIVKQIVENHSGYLEIKSQIGFGSEFNVYLPVN